MSEVLDGFINSLDGFSKIAASTMLAMLPEEAKEKLESSLVRVTKAMQEGDTNGINEVLNEYGGMDAIEEYLPAIRTMFPDLSLMLPPGVGIADANTSDG